MNSPSPLTVLCVEDEEPQLKLRKALFESAGFEFLQARTGVEALELFRTREVSAVVLDYWMSGMNGTVIAEQMKRERPTVPIIILSGWSSLPGETIGIVDTWLVKAREAPEQLLSEVNRLIKSRTDAKR